MSTQPKTVQDVSGHAKARPASLKTLLAQRVFRRISQAGFAIFIAYLVIQHVLVGESSTTASASAEAFCPFGGLETLYKYITTGGSFVSHTHLSNVVVLVAALAISLLFRSAFCGWICPLGFLQDLVHGLSKFLQKRISILRRAITFVQQRAARLAFLDRYLRFIKYLVLAWAVGGAAYFGTMVFRDYDPWSALLNIAEFSFTPGLVVLITLLVASFFIERPWCRYACPLGAANGLIGKLSPTYIKRQESACISCKLCTKACPMGIKVDTATTVKNADCIGCLECVGVCPREGALEVKVGLPVIGK